MKSIRSRIAIFALAISIWACAFLPTNPVAISSPVANPPTFVAPPPPAAITALPVAETIIPSPLSPPPTVANNQAFTEYKNGTLWVHVFSPPDEAVVQTAQIVVAGQAPADTVISLNNEVYVVSADQSFNIPVNLEEGPNALEFVASDLSGNEVAFTLTVTYEP